MPNPTTAAYLDYNATAPLCSAAKTAVTMLLEELGNPSSVHAYGRNARASIEDARDKVAALASVSSQAITFTSGATEANALAIYGLKASGAVTSVFCSAIEHPSVLENVAQENWIGVTRDGLIDLNRLDSALKATAGPALVCVMGANNETGVIQPIEEVKSIVAAHGGYLFCDLAQVPGKVSTHDFTKHADLYSFSAHKFGGPAGAGALVNPRGLEIAPLVRGGGQERSVRSGTENVLGIVGFGAAAQSAHEAGVNPDIATKRDALERAMLELRPDAVVFGRTQERLPNTISIALPQRPSQQQIIKLDLAGFAVSAGSACSSGKVSKSHVLTAMGVADELAGTAIRISIGRETTSDELEKFAEVWAGL